MNKNSKDYSDLKKEIVMNIITSYESRERLVLLSEIKNEENEKKSVLLLWSRKSLLWLRSSTRTMSR